MKMNKILTLAVIAMLAITSVNLFATKENNNSLPTDSSSGKATIGGNFTLTDTKGKTVSDTDFRGKYMLVFFGFTHCPDVCPTTMATITRTWELLGKDADGIAPIFITIDPKRDTPEQMASYIQNFDHRIVGLTGTENQIKTAADAYKAFYSEASAKEETDEHGKKEHGNHHQADGYTMEHSAFLYLMGKKGEYITHFPYTISPDDLAKKLKESTGS